MTIVIETVLIFWFLQKEPKAALKSDYTFVLKILTEVLTKAQNRQNKVLAYRKPRNHHSYHNQSSRHSTNGVRALSMSDLLISNNNARSTRSKDRYNLKVPGSNK